MKNQKNNFRIGDITNATGFIVPQEFIIEMNLLELEKTLGINRGQFDQGVVVHQLLRIPKSEELEYFGDTRSPEHRFEENRNKDISRDDLSKAGYRYIESNKNIILVKLSSIKNYDKNKSDDENWPAGNGAMQFKIRKGLSIPSKIIDVITDYPLGRFLPYAEKKQHE